jgi:hypothetical protein
MSEKTGFLETRPGYKSSTRLNTLIILLFWIVISTYQVVFAGGFDNFEFHILILTAAFAPKTISKFAEMQIPKQNNQEKQI